MSNAMNKLKKEKDDKEKNEFMLTKNLISRIVKYSFHLGFFLKLLSYLNKFC